AGAQDPADASSTPTSTEAAGPGSPPSPVLAWRGEGPASPPNVVVAWRGATPGAGATSNAYLAPAVPMFRAQAKAKASSSNGEGSPVVDLFAGYSYLRFNTTTPTASENFNWHGATGAIAGNVNRWFSLVADFGFYRMKDLPPNASGSAYT